MNIILRADIIAKIRRDASNLAEYIHIKRQRSQIIAECVRSIVAVRSIMSCISRRHIGHIGLNRVCNFYDLIKSAERFTPSGMLFISYVVCAETRSGGNTQVLPNVYFSVLYDFDFGRRIDEFDQFNIHPLI
jgi:hypothetical protein